MSLGVKTLDKIVETDLQQLVTNQVRENKKIEYKKILPGYSNAQKREFLSDISSFANAVGGDILYGIETKKGVPIDISGLHVADVDAEILRLESMLQSGIEPRIPGIKTISVSLQIPNVVIIIRIPKSWMSPHMVTFDNLSRFYSRNSAGKYQLDVSEIRNLFNFSQTIPEQIRAFRLERLSKVLAGETPIRVGDVPKIVLHLVPLSAFSSPISYDLTPIAKSYPMPMYASGCSGRYNFDGFLTYSQSRNSNTVRTYLQVYRNGIFEAVETLLLSDGAIPSVAYERELLKAIPSFLTFQEKMRVEPPILIMISFLGVNGFELVVDRFRFVSRKVSPIDRDNLIIPEIMLESYDANPVEYLKLIFETVWNAAGWPRCMNYDEEGKWVGH
ncbi:MAG: ATP-binding protein [Candidatus Bathyarchaeota archaeon]|nr:ATP-binding protein [Candidatus Bathyarchaeota archaeon]